MFRNLLFHIKFCLFFISNKNFIINTTPAIAGENAKKRVFAFLTPGTASISIENNMSLEIS